MVGWGAVLLLLAGCAPTGGETSHELRKVEVDRDQARTALTAERALSAALRDQLATQQREHETTQAEANALRERVATLEQATRALQGLIEQRGTAAVTRPETPLSPLPPAIDQRLATYAGQLAGRVTYDRGRGAVTFANDRMFGSGSDVVRPDAVAGLVELAPLLAGAMREHPDEAYDVVVVGHTDDAPITRPDTMSKHPTNWHLAVHRAIAVKTLLVQGGLPEARVAVMGYSSFRPVSDDAARNRRVEVFLVPRGAIQSFEPVRAPR